MSTANSSSPDISQHTHVVPGTKRPHSFVQHLSPSDHSVPSTKKPHVQEPVAPVTTEHSNEGSAFMNRTTCHSLPRSSSENSTSHVSASINRSGRLTTSTKNMPTSGMTVPHVSVDTSAGSADDTYRPNLPTTHLTTEVDVAKILTDMYSAKPELPKDSWTPVNSHTFINLALIKQHGISYTNKYVRSTIQGDIDDIMKNKESIKYENVFKNFQSETLVLIEGRPGSGKTTLVHKVSQDWANDKNILKGAELVFLVSLRILSTKENAKLLDILQLFYRNYELHIADVQKHLETCNGKGVCFILDGLDEYSLSDNCLISDIIHKKYLPLSMVIVASRPVATAKLRKYALRQVEVLGFMKEQIFEYVSMYEFQDKTQTSDSLKQYLNQHLNILHLCYLPVHTAMVCFLYEQLRSASINTN